MKNIIIANPEKLEETKKRIQKAGSEKLHVIADFDRTLTKAFVENQKSPTIIAQIRNGGYLGKDYVKKAHELFDIYHPIEINPKINELEKNKKMHEWWQKHFDLLIEKGLDKQLMIEITKNSKIQFRKGTLEFLDFLYHQKIPLVIMSASTGDMIVEHLKKEGKAYDNICVIANMYEFDEIGKAIKVKPPIIHSMNKHEIIVKEFPVYNLLKQRKNIILLGDNLEDIGMVKGFEYENLIKIGFLNENIEENLESYKKEYDVIILNDGNMNYVNELLKEII